MGKINLIISREYFTRVRKPSFVIMTILGPLLVGILLISSIYFSQVSDQVTTVTVVDETGVFHLADTKYVKIIEAGKGLKATQQGYRGTDNYSILYIPKTIFVVPRGIKLYSEKSPPLNVLVYLESQISKEIEKGRLRAEGIDPEILKRIKANVQIIPVKLTAEGEEKSNAALTTILGITGGFLIYVFIFLYGVQVMRGVIEEKTSRIVEVIISSVKPFQLMMGKILGIALVGLTQFLLWVILTAIITTGISNLYQSKTMDVRNIVKTNSSSVVVEQDISSDNALPDKEYIMKGIYESLNSIDFTIIVSTFIFYFLGGYLLYSALFAAIGAAVDNEADTQQFMLPVTLPLVFAFILVKTIMNNPEGTLAFWLSVIPFTSPVVMMIRIPFGVPYGELFLSMILLVAGFLFTTWFAGKIYRTGILMYGKRINYREISRWLFYKD